MARPDSGQPEPDPYRLLGVARQATPAEVTQAWRRRARAEHPDARPVGAGDSARFRALAEAYETLSDPRRRAAYDQAARLPEPESRPPRPAGAGTPVRVTVISPSCPPLRAGPVRVEPPDPSAARRAAADRRAWMLLRVQVAARWLDDVTERPW